MKVGSLFSGGGLGDLGFLSQIVMILMRYLPWMQESKNVSLNEWQKLIFNTFGINILRMTRLNFPKMRLTPPKANHRQEMINLRIGRQRVDNRWLCTFWKDLSKEMYLHASGQR